MRVKRKAIVVAGVLSLVTFVVLANPSEDQHLDRYVSQVHAWQLAHVQSCALCDEVMDANDLRLLAVSASDQSGTIINGGLRRKSYMVFSVLTNGGLLDARTVGFLGLVFGPSFRAPCPCPRENGLVIPGPRDNSQSTSTFVISVRADGTIVQQGRPVTREQLQSRLRMDAQQATTEIVIEADQQAEMTTVMDLVDWVTSLGFTSVTVKTAPSATR